MKRKTLILPVCVTLLAGCGSITGPESTSATAPTIRRDGETTTSDSGATTAPGNGTLGSGYNTSSGNNGTLGSGY